MRTDLLHLLNELGASGAFGQPLTTPPAGRPAKKKLAKEDVPMELSDVPIQVQRKVTTDEPGAANLEVRPAKPAAARWNEA